LTIDPTATFDGRSGNKGGNLPRQQAFLTKLNSPNLVDHGQLLIWGSVCEGNLRAPILGIKWKVEWENKNEFKYYLLHYRRTISL